MKRKTKNGLVDAYNITANERQRKSAELLPSYLQTEKNKKFLANTIDKLLEVPNVERINGYVGSTLTPNFDPTKDQYLGSVTADGTYYQFEPSLIVTNGNNKIKKAISYQDLLNQLEFNKSPISNHNKVLQPKTYSYNPRIDLDKFVNYNQYYWLEAGPELVEITGLQKSTISTYTVEDNTDGTDTWLLSPDGLTPNPMLTLFRGMTYVFNVSSKHSFYVKTTISYGKEDQYSEVVNNGTKDGQVIVTIDDTTPNTLYYIAGDDTRVVGKIVVKTLDENTTLDVEKDIIGKVTYRSGNDVEFINGLLIYFPDSVTPEYYRKKRFVVEGVGTKISLVDFDQLQNNVSFNQFDVNFDGTPFDQYPFDDFSSAPTVPEYVTINRSSVDKNPWTRYNRWFHVSVIEAAAAANGIAPDYPTEKRAKRPIIEFNPDIKLYNFGTKARRNVHLIDNRTKDAFSLVEKSAGYYVDGVLLEEGYRVIFNADTDPLVRGRVYEVTFEIINEKQFINLVEAQDFEPTVGDSIVTAEGTEHAGVNWWWDGSVWVYAQQKTSINQAPLFDLFDEQGYRFSDVTKYNCSFAGTKIFGYTEGTVYDSVLGLNLKFLNVANIGDFLFTNYFNTDTFVITKNGVNTSFPVSSGYLQVSDGVNTNYKNCWEESVTYEIPVLQYDVITEAKNTLEITAIENPGWLTDLKIEVFVNDSKKSFGVDYSLFAQDKFYFVGFVNDLTINDRVLLKLYTTGLLSSTGYYEPTPGLTNNPLNGPIGQITLAEVSDHLKTIASRIPGFTGSAIGYNNLKDLGNLAPYGTRLISHQNPLSFAHFFLGQKEYDIISAIRKVGFDYYYYKNSFINKLSELPKEISAYEAVETVLTELNLGKDVMFPYGYSDMLTYGKDFVERKYTVTDTRITTYSISKAFDLSLLSERAILVYHNNVQLLVGVDYTFDKYDPSITFNITLNLNDTIVIRDYSTTEGCYVPPTPTKLGLYPKFTPSIYIDNTYVTPTKVIQGHDGSIMVAYDDYRDDFILEFEKRIYNNLKVTYNPDLLDFNEILPGAYREKKFSYADVVNVLSSDFLKWAGSNGVDYTTNIVDVNEPLTYNYRTSAHDPVSKLTFPGHWRGIYKYFYDTDRPHTCPWEMLGFSEMPSWWETVYGPAPYTAGNLILWTDISEGKIVDGSRKGIDKKYIRSNLLDILPVDSYGNLRNPVETGLAQDVLLTQVDESWKLGDVAPSETAWRRSSLWPFAMQVLAATIQPATYSSVMFDPSRIKKSVAGQYSYGDNEELLRLTNLVLYRDVVDGTRQLGAGYSVLLIEAGMQRSFDFLKNLKTDLSNVNYKLQYKAEGFVSKEKLQVIIDSVDPTSTNPGVLLPAEDYEIILSKSNPIATFSASGILIQKLEGAFVVRGYDKFNPYFTVFEPIHSLQDNEVRIGGTEESYVTWTSGKFYQTGQLVLNDNNFYRTKLSHTSSSTFNISNFQKLPAQPVTGGISASLAREYSNVEIIVPYNTKFNTIQDAFDFIVGYGKWLESKGFVFNYLQEDFGQILDWTFSAKEFLFWTTQNWEDGSLITLSPFAEKIVFNTTAGTGEAIYGVAEDINSAYYEYNLLTADGSAFPTTGFTVGREGDEFVVSTKIDAGIYFVKFNLIQKQHALIFSNYSMFNDIIYDIETGYRQRRVKLVGFKTSNWDGGLTSPGFVFDEANIDDWQEYKDYNPGEVVRYSGKYYGANKKVYGNSSFVFDEWNQLTDHPTPQLLPNFDYKISQFEDFYSLDVDNFDLGQQRMAQHLTGYTPRSYLDNIFNDSIAQYKFYQGYIREKGTANAVNKLAKASLNNLKGQASFNETWAFRIGQFGGYNTYQELEIKLDDSQFVQNPQIIQFTNYPVQSNDLIYYKPVNEILIKPEDYDYSNVFPSAPVDYTDYVPVVPSAGYVRVDDITATAYNKNSLLDIANVNEIQEGSTFWIGFKENGDWDVLRYTRTNIRIIDFDVVTPGSVGSFMTNVDHGLTPGDVVAVTKYTSEVNKVYIVLQVPTPNTFIVATTLGTAPTSGNSSKLVSGGFIGDISVDSTVITNVASNDGLVEGSEVSGKGISLGTSITNITKENNGTYSVYISEPATVTASNTYLSYSYNAPNILIGQIFKFVSVRFKSFDEVASLPRLTNTSFGDHIWVDNDGNNKFVVYNKVDNYTPQIFSNGVDNAGQYYGFRTSLDSSTSSYAVSAPFYNDVNYGLGKVFLYERTSPTATDSIAVLSYSLNETDGPYVANGGTYFTSTIPPQFGYSLIYDRYSDIVLAGAPAASRIRAGQTVSGVRYVNSSTSLLLDNTGIVKISAIDRNTLSDVTLAVITSPSPTAEGRFGHSIVLSQSTSTKRLLVGAPGENKVYNFDLGMGEFNTSTVTLTANTTISSNLADANARFGYSIATSKDLTRVAVGAPGYDVQTGCVNVYATTGSTYTLVQTINKTTEGIVGTIGSSDLFGNKVLMNNDGSYLYISAPGNQYGLYQGAVTVWKWNSTDNRYTFLQRLENPNANANCVFGFDMAIDDDYQNLAITSLGNLETQNVTFDVYSDLKPYVDLANKYNKDPSSTPRKKKTTFDGNSTKFIGTIYNAGTVSIYNRYQTYYSYAQDITTTGIASDTLEGSNLGFSISQCNDNLYIGAPTLNTTDGVNNGGIIVYSKIDPTINSWSIHRHQENLVDISSIKKVVTLDLDEDKVVDYLEIIDPVKGKIAGAADQEITYKTIIDPAVYSLGNSGVTVDSNANWIDEKIGELWWDLSTVKYMWYEQGELEYRKNNWGATFPGSTISVYEWVRSEYLPSEWSALADTNEGLVKGISGQPKYPDNSVLSVKQIYNNITQTFSNVYYFWVKNKTTIPTGVDRRASALSVASLIADPTGQSIKYAMVLRPDALAVVNIKDSIFNEDIHLHINIETDVNASPRHTEWLLIQENDRFSLPTLMLERKMVDSLVGFDSVGNPVPDPALSARMKYGIETRPRQTMFVDRIGALRTLITWTNDILSNLRITSFADFDNLNAEEAIPDEALNEYDIIVEDNYVLSGLVTRGLTQAELTCTLNKNGGIASVNILKSGIGYNPIYPPTVTVLGNGVDAIIKTKCDERGQVIDAYVVNPGTGFTAIPRLVVRPYTAIVLADSLANGLWSKFEWDQTNKEWIRIHSQQYKTNLYWSKIDWKDSSFNSLQDFVTTVEEPYGLYEINVTAGDYVKVKNAGNGKYIVLRKTATGTIGTWDSDWDIVYEEEGTIRISDTVWNDVLTDYAFDEIAAFDQTLYDQAPNTELVYILRAIKNDLFTGPLTSYWNKFFFKAVKYALHEQHSLDWAFKTSYIDVTNEAGSLDQRATYKLQDSSYYESWINEVKPYHTKIRNFTVSYTSTEFSQTFTTDFDLPAYYNETTGKFSTLEIGNGLLTTYPYKSWNDNYTCSIKDITVVNAGNNYINPPVVKIIPAPGDTGTGATAESYISLGKVVEIVITNEGTGYTKTPTVLLEGGGGVGYERATAYASLTNSKIRSNNLQIKFDRTSYATETATLSVSDQFECTGESFEFDLTWVPQPDRNSIKVTADGSMILNDKFTIQYYIADYTNTNGVTYKKKFAKLLLNYLPTVNTVIKISYLKDINSLNAVDRILNYYQPTSGMPGIDLDQLMTGMSYGGVKVDTLPFNYASGWDQFGKQGWWTGAWDTYSSEANYGVVQNPQNNYAEQVSTAETRVNNAITSTATWAVQVSDLYNYYTSLPPYVSQNNQLVPNPAYQFALGQYNQAIIQKNSADAEFVSAKHDLEQYQSGKVKVTTPFDVSTGTTLNVYLNGTRIDNLSTTTVRVITSEVVVTSTQITTVTTPAVKIINTYTGSLRSMQFAATGFNIDDINTYDPFGATILVGRDAQNDLGFDLPSVVNTTYIVVSDNDINGKVNNYYQSLASTVTPPYNSYLYIESPLAYNPDTNSYGVKAIYRVTGLSSLGTSTVNYRVIDPNTDTREYYTFWGLNLQYLWSNKPAERLYAGYASPAYIGWSTAYQNISVGSTTTEQISVTSSTQIIVTTATSVQQTILGTGTTETIWIDYSLFTGTNNTVVFRDQDSDGTILPSDPDALDVIVSGGDWNTNLILGLAPADIILDGSAFVDTYSSHAPEELLPGQVQESFAVTVFEQKPEAGPLVINRHYLMNGATVTYGIGGKIASTSSVLVSLDNQPLTYLVDYTVNSVNNSVTLTSLPTAGKWLNITGMSVGGTKLLDSRVVTAYTATSTTINSVAILNDVNDVYVSINGIETTDYTLAASPGYETATNPRASLTVNHSPNGVKEIQAWFFNGNAKAYTQVHEQIFELVDPLDTAFTLIQPPGVVEPHHTQVIVEWNGRRLLPPQVSYYVVEENQTVFDISPNDPLSSGTVDLGTLEVYQNGKKLVKGIDYQISNPPDRLVITAGVLSTGDALAVVVLYGHEYYISNGTLTLNNVSRTANDTMKVITFTNHNAAAIRKEKFAANRSGKYIMDRAVSDVAYVWVEYNGTPLTADVDYIVDKDLKTVKLRKGIYQAKTDKVVVMSLTDKSYDGATGYRMFTDILGRTSYKRLSAKNTTRLAQPLVATDTKIYVEDASALAMPNAQNNLPGIVYIAGERIEFFSVQGNVLSQLRRGTLGTGLLDGLPTGTLVIDQSSLQNLPTKETIVSTSTILVNATNVYTATNIYIRSDFDYAKNYTNSKTLTPVTLPKPNLADIFEVRYGGVLLRKPTETVIVTDTTVAPDSGQFNSTGICSTSTLNADFTMSSVIINNNECPVVHFNFEAQPGVEVKISKRTATAFEYTPVFSFLESSPALLPNEDYYPGDPIIILETGAVLTDENEKPLEGI